MAKLAHIVQMSKQVRSLPYDADLRGVAAFVAIAHSTGVSEAARRLGVSKSTVSNRLRALEQQIGVQLLNRTTH